MFAEQLRHGDLSTVNTDALAQVDAGADMLDVNAGGVRGRKRGLERQLERLVGPE
jgi:cobalamin-dependent methionine synthase I